MEKTTVEKLVVAIESRDLKAVARLLGFIPENVPEWELREKVDEALKSYSYQGKILKF